jgi:hypothetical protein
MDVRQLDPVLITDHFIAIRGIEVIAHRQHPASKG